MIYDGDRNYLPSENIYRMDVYRIPIITSTIKNINYGENAVVNVNLSKGPIKGVQLNLTYYSQFNVSSNNIKGVVRGSVDDKLYECDVNNSNVSLIIPALSAGSKIVKIEFYGENNYMYNEASNIFKINKVNANISVNVSSVYNDNVTFAVRGPNDATGNVTLTIYNTDYVFDVVNGVANVKLSDLNSCSYPYTITYSGDDKYSSFTKTGTINVDKAIPTIKAEDMVIYYGNDYDFKATFFDSEGLPLANAYVVFKVNNNEHMVKTDSNGLAVLKIGLNAGNYTITSINTRTDETKINKLIVNPVELQPIDEKDINIPPLDNPSSDGTVLVKLPSDATGTVKLTIGNDTYTFDVTNGVANVKVPELAEGNYNFTITYSGDNKYSSFSKTNSISVTKIIPATITSSDITTVYNGGKYLIATLKDINGKPIIGATISVNINGLKYFTTDNDGQIKVSTNGLTPMNYAAKVSFNGNTNYGGVTAVIKVTIKKATPKLSATKKTFKKALKTKKYTITLKDNQNKAMKKAKVTLKIKGKKAITVKTNAKGKATFKIKKLTKKGTYKATVTYKGDKCYNKVTKKVNIKIK